ncbi:MAG: ATP-dependent Clp protease ATP-binding subunit [Candidatus Margulisbacteria bacterium]|nr:ATP-dependent Clp protease ATP-binding subunit [Candidatus Margulisiibacteriota bacterium]
MFSRFTQKAIQVIMFAQEKAKKIKIPFINNELLLYGILKTDDPLIITALNKVGIDINYFRSIIQKHLQNQKGTYKNETIPFSPQVKLTLSQAWDEARQLGHNHVSVEHLFLAILKDSSPGITNVIIEANIDILKIRNAILEVLGESYSASTLPPEEVRPQTPTLDLYSLDLTLLAKENKLDPVIGREFEIKRIIQILSRRNKNNPVLTGEAGVGKTAIVEGLAQRIVNAQVPPNLLNKRVVTLDLGLLVAGTRFRGEFEERIKKILDEIKNDKTTVLFIDELHTIIGTGNSEGSLDAANMLKPALARGEIQCIGATTLNEFRKTIENDAALERRFQSILIDPPTPEETLEILKGLRKRYEDYHKVTITDEALEGAVYYSSRYITNRQLPDKAVDLIDEAASTEMLEASKTNLLQNKPKKEILVTRESIISVVSIWTGIPLKELSQSEAARLKNMAEDIAKHVIGQTEAIQALSKSIKRTKAGLKDPKRPTGSFLFLGPSGVGKTELARQLAKYLFGKEDAIVRIDMSEYTEKHTISRLIGSPPGYVGYNEGGLLSEPVRKKPYSIVLFDEIEKAHPEVINLLLQIMEDGRLTDSTGKLVDFKNTIVIMTSNVGAKTIENTSSFGFRTTQDDKADYERMKEKIMGEIKEAFSPEFINRIDDIIIFKALTKEYLGQIAQLFLDDLNTRVKDKELIIKLSQAALDFLIDKAYVPNKGARLLRKVIQDNIEDKIADLLIDKDSIQNSTILVDAKDKELKFTVKTKKTPKPAN